MHLLFSFDSNLLITYFSFFTFYNLNVGITIIPPFFVLSSLVSAYIFFGYVACVLINFCLNFVAEVRLNKFVVLHRTKV